MNVIAAILLVLAAVAGLSAWACYERARDYEEYYKEVDSAYSRIHAINADLQQELIRTGAHRDELQARYHEQEADREIKEANAALRSERGRKGAQARWGRRAA